MAATHLTTESSLLLQWTGMSSLERRTCAAEYADAIVHCILAYATVQAAAIRMYCYTDFTISAGWYKP
eukprot:6062-Heterococcus_DN1.PRE.2